MTTYSITRISRYHHGVSLILLITLIALVALPGFADTATLRLATEMAGYMALAVMWNLLAGYAGVMSIGQQAFVGAGGYALFMLAGFAGLPLIPAVLLSGLIAAALALPVGYILFRLNGAYFAIGSWVIAGRYSCWSPRNPRPWVPDPASAFPPLLPRSSASPPSVPLCFGGSRWRWPWQQSQSPISGCARRGGWR